MTVEEIKVYCRNKHKVTEEFPFGDVPNDRLILGLCFSIGRGVWLITV